MVGPAQAINHVNGALEDLDARAEGCGQDASPASTRALEKAAA
jgi:hypothetical protein